MRQLTHKLKDGTIQILDVPPPVLSEGQVLVRTHYSVISGGTEGSTVSAGRKSYIGKAKDRPEQFRQVLGSLSQKGVVQTYRAVMKKLEAYSPLGYSCAGEVVETAPGVREFARGDLVACGGAGYANHSEFVAVPVNLCVKLQRDARLDLAAYNTVGAIALQGVRQAELTLGETCVVVGLGLIGQLTCLLLKAAGVKVVGVDVVPRIVEIARDHCADRAFIAGDGGIDAAVSEMTNGVGADAVIIAAATQSEDPVNLAGALLRKRGKVVIVGRVPTNFEQDAYYTKELDLRMSCSYGPGRYDPAYEEGGIDYPPGYVRWTENRNMQAFQDLLHSSMLDLEYLTTHRFTLEDAPQAYDLILRGDEPHLGIVVEYAGAKSPTETRIATGTCKASAKIGVAFIGAGSYAMNNLLPNVRGNDVALKCVMTATGTSSRSVADRYGFESCTSDENDIWNDESINTTFIATRHDSHAEYVLKALRHGHNVFVEKPLCLTVQELDEIALEYGNLERGAKAPQLMIGFNRRFSPLTDFLKKRIGEGPMAAIYRVNAGPMPADAWMQIPEVGGGRIIGEACHFIDYLTYMNGSLPVEVHAVAMGEAEHLEDTVSISLRFENGSIGTVSYLANGSTKLPKEYVEIYRAGTTGVLSDFKEARVYGRRVLRRRLPGQDKGQAMMMQRFLGAVRNGEGSPIPFRETHAVMLATFRAVESMRTRTAATISIDGS